MRSADAALENGEADIGFNTGPIDGGKFSCHPFLRYPLYIVAHRNHPYAALKSFPTKYLDRLPMVVMEMKPDEPEFFKTCRANGGQARYSGPGGPRPCHFPDGLV